MPYRAHRFLLSYLFVSLAGVLALSLALRAASGALGMGSADIGLALDALTEPLCLGVCLLGYALLVKKPERPRLNMRLPSVKQAVIVIAVVLASEPLMWFVGALSSMVFKNLTKSYIHDITRYPIVLGVFVACLIPAVCEETIMRGVVFSNYRGVDIRIAAVVNGLFFGLFHLNFQQASYAFALGIVLTFIVYYTDSLPAAMLAHFTINLFSVALSYAIPAPETPPDATWGEVIAFSRVAAVSAAMVFILLRLLARTRSGEALNAADPGGNGAQHPPETAAILSGLPDSAGRYNSPDTDPAGGGWPGDETLTPAGAPAPMPPENAEPAGRSSVSSYLNYIAAYAVPRRFRESGTPPRARWLTPSFFAVILVFGAICVLFELRL